MEKLYAEGVAIHGGPESCVGAREGAGEALTGARVGRAIEPRNLPVRGADTVPLVEGNTASGVMRDAGRPRAVEEPWHARNLQAREPGDPTARPSGDHRAGRSGNASGGKPEMNERGKSDGPVVPANPPNKAASAEAGRKRGPAKGNTDGETRPGHRAGIGVSRELDRVREVARRNQDGASLIGVRVRV